MQQSERTAISQIIHKGITAGTLEHLAGAALLASAFRREEDLRPSVWGGVKPWLTRLQETGPSPDHLRLLAEILTAVGDQTY